MGKRDEKAIERELERIAKKLPGVHEPEGRRKVLSRVGGDPLAHR